MSSQSAITFSVPGPAGPKQRTRVSTRHGRLRLYTPAKTATYEAMIRMAASEAAAVSGPLPGAVEVDIIVRLAPPTSTSARKRRAMLDGAILPAKRPDLDNLVKAVLDGCNGTAIVDDRFVVKVTAEKRYAQTSSLEVRITPLPDRSQTPPSTGLPTTATKPPVENNA